MKLKFNSNNLIFYLVFWLFLFLLGSYIGGSYRFIFIFLTILVTLDLIHFIISVNSIYYYQNFSTEHPQKGENVEYKLTIENRLSFTPCYIDISFNKEINLETKKLPIKTFTSSYIESKFSLPYRGIYKVGIENIRCADFLKLLTYQRSFWPRTFYVYPRINKNLSVSEMGKGESTQGSNVNSNKFADFIETIDEYRVGCKMSHISWKHFAALGKPYTKKFYSEECSNANIFLDRTSLVDQRIGPVDDLAIETMLSIIKFNIDREVSTRINNQAHPIDNELELIKLQKESIRIQFNKKSEETLIEFGTQNYSRSERLFIITTFENRELLDLDLIQRYENLTIYIITKHLSKKNNEILTKTVKGLGNLVEIICIS